MKSIKPKNSLPKTTKKKRLNQGLSVTAGNKSSSALASASAVERFSLDMMRGRVICEDGLSLSVQANSFVYCSPKSPLGPYNEVECGFPDQGIKELIPYAEDPYHLTETIYGYVPVALVSLVIARHGGRSQSSSWSMSPMMNQNYEKLDVMDCSNTNEPWSPLLAEKDCNIWLQVAALGSPKEEGCARMSLAQRMGEYSWEKALKNLEEVMEGMVGSKINIDTEQVGKRWGRLCFKDWELTQIASASMPSKDVKKKRL